MREFPNIGIIQAKNGWAPHRRRCQKTFRGTNDWICVVWLPPIHLTFLSERLKGKALPSSSSSHSSTPLTTLPLLSLSEVSILSSSLMYPIADWTWMALTPQVPNRTYDLPPGPPPICEQGLKGISQACHFQRTSLLRSKEKVREGTVSRGRCQIRKESHRPCQHGLKP